MTDGNLQRLDSLKALRAFTQVARLGSVSRAAEVLGVSQPAVTLQLQALARQHGVDLLERSGRRLVPTPAGDALLALARPLVDGIDGLAGALDARLRSMVPTALDLAAGSVALARLVTPAVLPDATPRPRVRHAGGGTALELLREGAVALAVGSWLDPPGDIEVLPLLQAPSRLLLPAAHPLAGAGGVRVERLADHPLVLPRLRHGTRQLVELAYGRAGLPAPTVVEAGDWHAVSRLVALGQGISVSNALALEGADLAGLAVRPLPPIFPARPYGIALRRGRTPSPAASDFIDAVRAVAASAADTWDEARPR